MAYFFRNLSSPPSPDAMLKKQKRGRIIFLIWNIFDNPVTNRNLYYLLISFDFIVEMLNYTTI